MAIIEDDVAGPLFKELRAPVFSPDSRHLAYVGQTYGKKMALVIDGAVSSEWDVKGTGEPVFSPDSRRVAVTLERVSGGFLRKQSLYTVAVDGQSFPEEPGDDVSLAPAFNPDGTSVAWWLQRGKEAFMVINGVVQQNTVGVVSDFQFDGLGRVVYAGQSGSLSDNRGRRTTWAACRWRRAVGNRQRGLRARTPRWGARPVPDLRRWISRDLGRPIRRGGAPCAGR